MRPAGHLLGSDDATALGSEAVELEFEILINGADAGIIDAAVGTSPKVSAASTKSVRMSPPSAPAA
jgi:hypothetical protein